MKQAHMQQHGWALRALSKISQTEKDKYCIIQLTCGTPKIKQTGEYNKKIDSQTQRTNQW